jgi:hypothetical protein
VIVANNTTYQATGPEIELQYNCDGITIKNNILYARSGQAYISNDGGNNTNVAVANNLCFGASLTSSGSYLDLLARFVNPLLASPPSDLHLRLGSPAINTGIDLGNDALGKPVSGTWDVDGKSRVQGIAIDIGAHEFAVTTAGVPQRLTGFALEEVGPNPGSGPIRIAYSLAHEANVEVEVFDVRGGRVASLVQGVRPVGTYTALWNARMQQGAPAPAGMYLIRYRYPGGQQLRRVALVR